VAERLLGLSTYLQEASSNLKAIKKKEKAEKRQREGLQCSVAKMLLSWDNGNAGRARTYLERGMHSEPNAAEANIAKLTEWWCRSSDAIRRSAGEPAFVKDGDRVKQEAGLFLSEVGLHGCVVERPNSM
jgi:hypothetical protein